MLIWVCVVRICSPWLPSAPPHEAFTQNDAFLFATGPDVYNGMYATIYDQLLFSNLKNDYEIGQIINATTPSTRSRILDVGCGTGHHVAQLAGKNIPTKGVDISPDMIAQAKKNYPQYEFDVADGLNADAFSGGNFTHILCMYFTLYYMPDKLTFFQNCMKWLEPGGYLVLHLVDRDQFDPILPPGNPLMIVSPQKYADSRITHTQVQFNNFTYTADFDLDADNNKATLIERFKDKTSNKERKQEHELFMEPIEDIIQDATSCGFIQKSRIDLVHCQYEYQYLYVLYKPN